MYFILACFNKYIFFYFRDLSLALEYGCLENELMDFLLDHYEQGHFFNVIVITSEPSFDKGQAQFTMRGSLYLFNNVKIMSYF